MLRNYLRPMILIKHNQRCPRSFQNEMYYMKGTKGQFYMRGTIATKGGLSRERY